MKRKKRLRQKERKDENPDSSELSQKKEREINSSSTIPPPLEHVKIYFDEKITLQSKPKSFLITSSNGWLVGGRARMKDWKAAARNWILNIPKFAPRPKPSGNNQNQPQPIQNYGEPL